MPRYGPADVTVTYNSQLLPDVTVIGDVDTQARNEEITPFGQTFESHAYVGVKGMPAIQLEAPYADDANQLLAEAETVGLGGTATLAIVFGGAKSVSVSTILTSIKRVMSRGQLSKTVIMLQPTGTITEA